jgi:Fe2+ or Zn2+ uptake regulation protein
MRAGAGLSPIGTAYRGPSSSESRADDRRAVHDFLTRSRFVSKLRLVKTEVELQRLLRDATLRVTRPRVSVLAAVYAAPHADTDSLIRATRAELPHVSHQAVYDVLRALTRAGLVRRIQPAGSLARYEARVGDNHHHVVCRSCGAIADVDCVLGEAPCLSASDDHGFLIDQAEVTYWGRCPTCSPPATPDSPATLEGNP